MTQALDKLFTENHFSICTLDRVLDLIGKPQRGEAYELLNALHCVHFNKMQPELRNRIPQLVNECLRPPQQPPCLATDVALQGVEI